MARPLQLAGAPALDVHLLPAAIEHDGPANVEAYFRPTETGAMVDGLPVLQASLRGRSLAGAKLPLPEAYTGAVLESRAQEAAPASGASQDDAAGGAAAPAPPAWAATATFQQLHYYNHDAAPLRGDPLRRCLDWAALAAAVHAPVDPAAVDAAAAAAQQQQQQPAGAAS